MDPGSPEQAAPVNVLGYAFPSDPDLRDKMEGIVRSVMADTGADRNALATVVGRIGSTTGWIRLGPRPDDVLGLEYVDLVTPAAGFSRLNCPDAHRPVMGLALLVDRSGIPVAMTRVDGDPRDPRTLYGSFRGTGCTVVTDRTGYDGTTVRALESTGNDHILVQHRFPASYGPTSNQRMQDLRWGDRTYRTCKCRYDRRWLFRFIDPVECGIVSEALTSDPGIPHGERDRYRCMAGVTDAVSPTGFDIREVRRMLDIRRDTDSWMRRCWDGACSDPLCSSPDSAFGLVAVSIIARTVSMRNPGGVSGNRWVTGRWPTTT